MNHANFRFYEELNDFLPSGKKKIPFDYSFNGKPSVKDAIEAIGVPHVEVDLILVNSISVDFSCKLADGDQVSVYPQFESIDITPVIRLRKNPLRNIRFILDVHLGKLTRSLRLCGFDSYFNKDLTDPEIIELSLSEKRVILTRDKEMLKNKMVDHGYWIRSKHPDEQIIEVLNRFDLKHEVKPFTRCMECNGLLDDAPKEKILDYLLPATSKYFQKFLKCSGCGRIYWEGSHYESMQRYLDSVFKNVN